MNSQEDTQQGTNRFAVVTRNISVLFVGSFVNKAAGALSAIILIRYIGEVGAGKYAVANSFTALFTMVADLGLGILAVRAVSQNHDLAPKYLGNIAILRILLASAVFIITCVGAFITGIPSDTLVILWLVAGSMLFAQIANGYRWTFQAFQRMQYEAVLLSGESLVMLGAGTLVLVIGYGLFEFSVVRLFFSAVTFGASVWLTVTRITRPKYELDRTFCKSLFIDTKPLIAFMVLNQIQANFDIVMLSFFKGDIETAWYYVAMRYIFVLQMIPLLFNQTTFPAMVNAVSDTPGTMARVMERTYRFMIIITLGISVITVLFSTPIIRLLYTAEFDESASILIILIWMQVFKSFNSISQNAIIAYHRETFIMKVTIFSLAVHFLLNLFLIPRWGAIGAGWAITLSVGLSAILMLREVTRIVDDFSFHRTWFRPALAAACAAFVASMLQDTYLVIGIGVTMIVYVIVLVLIRAIPNQDLKLALDFIKQPT